MGWNTGYKIFEKTVIGAYNLWKLDTELLTVLMEPYRGTDIDSGGRTGMLTNDGKEVEQVVVETFGGEWPKKPASEYSDANRDEWLEYEDKASDAFWSISRGKFGWC